MEAINGGKDNRQARNLKTYYVHPAKQKLTGIRGKKVRKENI